MNFTLVYITVTNVLVAAQDHLHSKMFLASSFSALCCLLTLLGTAEAQNSSSPSSPTVLPPSTVVPSGPPLPTDGFSKLGNVLKPTVTPYTFVPFPAPSETAIPGVFPETWPENPPPADDLAIPDFGPAWENAYKQAMVMVSRFSKPPLLLPCKLSSASVIIPGPGSDSRTKS